MTSLSNTFREFITNVPMDESFKDFVDAKAVFKHYKLKTSTVVPIFLNPTEKEWSELKQWQKEGEIDRFMIMSSSVYAKAIIDTETGNLYAWPAFVATHDIIATQLKLTDGWDCLVDAVGGTSKKIIVYRGWPLGKYHDSKTNQKIIDKLIKRNPRIRKVESMHPENINIKPLTEEVAPKKNLHMTHMEDRIFDDGVSGLQYNLKLIDSMMTMLSGAGNKKVAISTKFDGAPAIVLGQNPENGRFFVGTKSVFNKRTPKIN